MYKINRLRASIAAWLDASQRIWYCVWLNRSAREYSVICLEQSWGLDTAVYVNSSFYKIWPLNNLSECGLYSWNISARHTSSGAVVPHSKKKSSYYRHHKQNGSAINLAKRWLVITPRGFVPSHTSLTFNFNDTFDHLFLWIQNTNCKIGRAA